MPDARVYRAAFVPLLLVALLAAFSLRARPAPATTPLSAEAFSGPEAMEALGGLARLGPDRAPGAAGERAVGRRVAGALRARGFAVARRAVGDRTVAGRGEADLVTGVRAGLSSRRIVVVADRAAASRPGLAELSGTAALLELARIFRSSERRAAGPAAAEDFRAGGRDLRSTLVLGSSAGLGLGADGATAEALREAVGPAEAVDAVIVLGDLAGRGLAKPWVVPWSAGEATAPLALQRTVEAAVRREVGQGPGGARASAQWIRRAVPATAGPQGALARAGLPAVALAVSGERWPAPGVAVSERRLAAFGRSALRAVTAIDAVGAPASAPAAAAGSGGERRAAAFADAGDGVVTARRVLPGWAVRLLVAAALLPALLATLDAFFRARRRGVALGRWAAWVLAGALAPLAAWAWLRLLVALGAARLPAGPVAPRDVPFGAGEALGLLSALGVLALGVLAVRRWPVRLRPGTETPAGGATVVGLLATGTVALAWVANPYAAALLLPAAHLWPFLVSPDTRLRGPLGVAALALGGLGPALAALAYAHAFAAGPLEVAWLGVVLAAGGALGPAGGAIGFALAALGVAVVRLVAARRGERRAAPPPPPPRTRPRGLSGYAGPGSLGGTESALRR